MGSIQRPEATLEDRWEKAGETLLLTGIQALVRLPLVRHQLDKAMGWNTAGYVSGYRGSPLGTYDQQLMKQAKRLAEANIVVRPALNEDLAATAVWGTQQVALYGNQQYAAASTKTHRIALQHKCCGAIRKLPFRQSLLDLRPDGDVRPFFWSAPHHIEPKSPRRRLRRGDGGASRIKE